MIPAFQKDEALLEDIQSAEPEGFCAWWLGQSGFLIKWQGEYLLFDPYLSDSLTRKYAETDKPHVRMSELAIDPARLDFVRYVTSSHNHTDHLDYDTLAALGEISLILPQANIEFARDRMGDAPIEYLGIDTEISTQAGPWKITGITAAHNEVVRDENGHSKFLGFIAEFGDYCIYHTGDTLWHDELVGELSPFDIDLAFHPINGNKPERRVAGNLNGKEAAELAARCGIGVVVPHHFHLFEFNTAEPDVLIARCEELNQSCRVLRIGERIDIS